MGRRLVLDRSHLVAMLRAPEFYEAVPEFAYLQATAVESWQMFQAGETCKGCSRDWKYMQGVCDAAFIKLKELQADNPEVLGKIKAWLSKRKGYTISTVVLYYRRSMKQGRIAAFKF